MEQMANLDAEKCRQRQASYLFLGVCQWHTSDGEERTNATYIREVDLADWRNVWTSN